jgi:serine/threonine protein kinase
MAIQIGDMFGDYQVTGVLGRGGMGKVYRVRNLVTDREEAMKVALSDVEADSPLADRFLREIKIHASLQHPNIAALHTAMRIEGRLVMIVELIEGASLEERLRQGPFDIPSAIHYVAQVLRALGFAHERGVIHRDIKPANILITAGGMVKLTDFGIARSSDATRLTGTGLAVGTLAYMSPEQIRSGVVDARSDIYSLGLTFYEMVTGRRAIQADTEHALMNAQLDEMPAEPAACNPQVPPAISAAIMRALAKHPERRFQTAAEFAGALQHPAPLAPAGTSAVSQAELADLEARLSRAIGPIARRLVPEAAHRYGSISEIRQALAAQIEDPAARQEFLKTGVTASTVTIARTPAPATFDAKTLEIFAHALAPYLGPIAKVVVQRAARNARSIEELQKALVGELPSADDRRRFLDAVRSAL